MITKFKINQGYVIYKGNGSISLECVGRTEKTVKMQYDDGEIITKRIKTKWINLDEEIEYIVVNGIEVIA
jgi:hypothetical protein